MIAIFKNCDNLWVIILNFCSSDNETTFIAKMAKVDGKILSLTLLQKEDFIAKPVFATNICCREIVIVMANELT